MTLLSWVPLSCSGASGGIYAKTSKRSGSTQLDSAFPTHNSLIYMRGLARVWISLRLFQTI